MIEIFIAVFGLIFYAIAMGRNRSTVRNTQRHAYKVSTYISSRQMEMRAKAVDRDLEADICDKVIPRYEMKDGFDKYGVDTDSLPLQELRHLYSDLLLAKAGKVRSSYIATHRNILGMGYPKYRYEGEACGTARKARRDAWIRCLLAIESELLSHGIDPFFIFIPTTGLEGGYSWAPATPVRLRNIGSNRYSLGQVWMLCASYYDESLKRM